MMVTVLRVASNSFHFQYGELVTNIPNCHQPKPSPTSATNIAEAPFSHPLSSLQFYKIIFSEQATTKPLDDIAWYITSKAPFNTEYGIVEFFDFTEYVMSSLTIIGELLSVAGIAERADRLVPGSGRFQVRI